MEFHVSDERRISEFVYKITGVEELYRRSPGSAEPSGFRPERAEVRMVNGKRVHVSVSGPFIRKDGSEGAWRTAYVFRPSEAPAWVRDVIADAQRRHDELLPEPPAA